MTSLTTLLAAYLLGGLTFLPLLICGGLYVILYTTPPVGDPDPAKRIKNTLQASSTDEDAEGEKGSLEPSTSDLPPPRLKPLQGWLIARRTYEESPAGATYMGMMRSFLDSRSKDRRPRDTYYAVLKGSVLYLYEDEGMSECFAALDAGAYNVEIWPHEGALDGELFAKRNSIRLSTRTASAGNSPSAMANVSKDMKLEEENEVTTEEGGERKKEKAKKVEAILAEERAAKRTAAFDLSKPWYLFVKNNSEMEDWYLALVQASSPVPAGATDPADPLGAVFNSTDMAHLVSTLDAQPDAIPTRWLNALLGRLFFSVYRTARVETYILNRLANKLSKVKRPGFLTALSVREASVGSRPPTISTPMLKELTKWGDAALELKFQFEGEMRLTIAATAEINLGTRFRPYVVQLVLAVVVRKVEGNVLVKVKRPPSNRIWYAFTAMPKLEIEVLPVVSDREIKWGVVLKPIETQIREIIRESIVMPNMDDIPFFESVGYEHRGGIWPDAARRKYVLEEDDITMAPNPAANVSAPTSSDTATSSAPASIIGLATGDLQAQQGDLPPISESTPELTTPSRAEPLDKAKGVSTEGLVPAPNGGRSRSPSPAGLSTSSVDDKAKEREREKEQEKNKVAPAQETAVSPKRMSWFSRSTPTPAPSPTLDSSRGRTTGTESGSSTATKAGTNNIRGHSVPRSSLLLGVDSENADTSHSSSGPARVNTSTDTAGAGETPFPEPSKQGAPSLPSSTIQDTTSGKDATIRSTTPIVTVNGSRRATVSHHASRSVAADFYSGGSVSTSSLPPAQSPSTTATTSDSEMAKTSSPSSPRDVSFSSATSSMGLSDTANTGVDELGTLARTSSNSSTHSISKPPSVSMSSSTATETPATSTNSPPPAARAVSPDARTPPNTASFLSTWKTRAADKQALSNTAKEAMKKWSVGWNNLKRNVDEERERRRASTNNVVASGSGVEDEGSGSDIGAGGVGSASRAPGRKTFAEMRADVMSRREGAPTPVDVKDSDSSTQHDATPPNGSSPSPAPSAKSRPTSITSAAPAAPKTTTEVHATPNSFEESQPVIEQPKPKPIGVQPGRAAGMMIPGIHASHQGEVMALGSTSTDKDNGGMDKAHPKDQADRERTLSQSGRPSSIQNVYRLFGQRTISTGTNDSHIVPGNGHKTEIVTQPKAAASSASIDTISITPIDTEPPEPSFPSTDTPRSSTPAPLLPPRAFPIMMPSPRSPPPPLPPRNSTALSAASEALKKAAAADDVARNSRPQTPQAGRTSDEHTSGTSTPKDPAPRASSPPPLPPRTSVPAG
ncbi:hypothetical protein FRC10_002597 [Ceratobasidium sp. 414]|nr:hypothetical protein FRC10_002597 [Ceratobasidium sp. 414]